MRITAPGGQGLQSRDKSIEPGENQKIIVSMSTRGYTKTLNKQIKIQTTDPNTGLLTITMRAKVQEILGTTPRLVNLGKVQTESIHTRELMVENKGKDPISISRVTASPDNMVTIAPAEPFTLKPGEEKRFEVTFNSGSAKGHTGGYIDLATDMEYLPKKIIRIRAQVVQDEKP